MFFSKYIEITMIAAGDWIQNTHSYQNPVMLKSLILGSITESVLHAWNSVYVDPTNFEIWHVVFASEDVEPAVTKGWL